MWNYLGNQVCRNLKRDAWYEKGWKPLCSTDFIANAVDWSGCSAACNRTREWSKLSKQITYCDERLGLRWTGEIHPNVCAMIRRNGPKVFKITPLHTVCSGFIFTIENKSSERMTRQNAGLGRTRCRWSTAVYASSGKTFRWYDYDRCAGEAKNKHRGYYNGELAAVETRLIKAADTLTHVSESQRTMMIESKW